MPIPNLHVSLTFLKKANKTLTAQPNSSVRTGFHHLFRISLVQDQVRLLLIILRTLHASHKQSALHKLIKFNHTTLERKTARHMLFHLISPSPYTIRNLPQLLQPTDFCVQKHGEEKKKKHFQNSALKEKRKSTKFKLKIKSSHPEDLKKETALLRIITGHQMLSCHFLIPMDTIQIHERLTMFYSTSKIKQYFKKNPALVINLL